MLISIANGLEYLKLKIRNLGHAWIVLGIVQGIIAILFLADRLPIKIF